MGQRETRGKKAKMNKPLQSDNLLNLVSEPLTLSLGPILGFMYNSVSLGSFFAWRSISFVMLGQVPVCSSDDPVP